MFRLRQPLLQVPNPPFKQASCYGPVPVLGSLIRNSHLNATGDVVHDDSAFSLIAVLTAVTSGPCSAYADVLVAQGKASRFDDVEYSNSDGGRVNVTLTGRALPAVTASLPQERG